MLNYLTCIWSVFYLLYSLPGTGTRKTEDWTLPLENSIFFIKQISKWMIAIHCDKNSDRYILSWIISTLTELKEKWNLWYQQIRILKISYMGKFEWVGPKLWKLRTMFQSLVLPINLCRTLCKFFKYLVTSFPHL